MRLIDDFLYITTSLDAAKNFLRIMLQANEEFGFIVNPSKTKTIFSCELVPPNCVKNRNLLWCGLVFDCRDFQVSPDYSRYAGSHVDDTITTIGNMETPGVRLRRMLIQHLKPKCHLLLLDEQINTHTIVLKNMYKIVAFVAIKFHTYATSLSHRNNPAFLWSTFNSLPPRSLDSYNNFK